MASDEENKKVYEDEEKEFDINSSKDDSIRKKPDELTKLDPDVSKWSEEDWSKLRSKFRSIIFNRGIKDDGVLEIIQETCLAILRDSYKIDKKNPFFWSIRVLENKIYNYSRIKSRQQYYEVEIDNDTVSSPVLISSDSYDERKEFEKERELTLKQCADECLEKLPYEERRTFKEYKTLSHNSSAEREKIAKRVGKSVEALRVDMHRTLKKVQNCINDCKKREGI